MSVIARLEVLPTRDRNMSDAVARAVSALDDFDVSYEVTPTGTVVEADDADEVFAAAAAAHRAVDDERVVTSLEVDEQPGRMQDRDDRVASVEAELGRPARRDARGGGGGRGQQGGRQQRVPSQGGQPQRYGGPRRSSGRVQSGQTGVQTSQIEAQSKQSGPQSEQFEPQTGQSEPQPSQSEPRPNRPRERESRYLGTARPRQ